MQKIGERKDKLSGYYYKYYSQDQLSVKEFYTQLRDSGQQFDNVMLLEGVEADMQNVSGTCSLDSLVEDYDEILANASDMGRFSISLFGKYDNEVYNIFSYPRENDNIGLQSENPALELTDILQKKSELEKGRSK